jgi:phosphoribosyl 1,2-cyclic phosphodiesterase
MRLANMRAVICSHQHSDHSKFLPQYAARGIRGGIGPAGIAALDGFVDCRAFATPHDAPGGTYGFHIVERGTNSALCVIMDAGSFNTAMRDAINASDCVVIGVDYDDLMEQNGDYDPSLQSRIRSNTGHCSNQQLADFVHRDWNGRARTWILAHLSDKRNSPMLARTRFLEACRPGCNPVVIVSEANKPTDLVSVNL